MGIFCAPALALLLLGTVAFAQEPEPEEEPLPRVELEYVSSDVFRSGMAIVKVWRGLHVETEYFGGVPYDVAISGGSWKFRWKALTFAPGLGVGYGSPVNTKPVATFRWRFETKRWFSQGFFANSLGDQEEREPSGELREVGAAILDNNHFSIRLGPFEAGPMWERITYRDEDEWKGGLRAAIRWKKLKGIFQVVAPEREFRGGIAFEY